MYKSLKYLLLSGAILAASHSIASTIPVLKVTPATTSVTMAPGSSTTLVFTVSNNMAVDLKVTNIKPLSNMSNLNASITDDACTGVTLINNNFNNNFNNCSVTASITSANVTTKQSGFFDVTACIDGGAQCSASRVKAKFTIDPDASPVGPTSLTRSVENLALSVSGTARTITITNTGSESTSNLVVSNTDLPTGTTDTTISDDCPSALAGGGTCTVTITPGDTASSDNQAVDCTTGTAPEASVITVSADNATSVTSNVYVLGYGCQYQEGFVYSIDDTTAASGSIGGKVASLSDQSTSYPWGATSEVGGISENSIAGANSCDGKSDGGCNTARIVDDANQTGNVAAKLCNDYDSGAHKDWYLPAICEMGVQGTGSDAGCGTIIPNIVTNLAGLVGTTTTTDCLFGANCLSGYYWSSTEYSSLPQNFAWGQFFSSGGSGQNGDDRGGQLGVRCSRALSL